MFDRHPEVQQRHTKTELDLSLTGIKEKGMLTCARKALCVVTMLELTSKIMLIEVELVSGQIVMIDKDAFSEMNASVWVFFGPFGESSGENRSTLPPGWALSDTGSRQPCGNYRMAHPDVPKQCFRRRRLMRTQ